MYTFPFVPFRYSKTATVGIVILVLCLIPSSEFSKLHVQITYADVIAHFFMYSAFAAALYWDITRKRINLTNKLSTMFIALLISTIFGIITELLQYYITVLNRSGSVIDLLFDMLGATIGIGITALIIRRKSAPEPGYH